MGVSGLMKSEYSSPLPCRTCKYALKPVGEFSRAEAIVCEKYSTIDNPKPNGVLFGNQKCEYYAAKSNGSKNDSVDSYRARRAKRMVARNDGGPGSGNWGHVGRPGEVGGSGEGGGKQNRYGLGGESGFTSFAKVRKEASKMHTLTVGEQSYVYRPGAKLILEDGTVADYDQERRHFIKPGKGFYYSRIVPFDGSVKGKIAIPKESSANYNLPKSDVSFKDFKKKYDEAFNPETRREADDKYRAAAGEVWNDSSGLAKKDLVSYTGNSYESINRRLRDGYMQNDPDITRKVNNITKMIDKCELQQDSVLPRGMSMGSFEKMFNLPLGSVNKENIGKLSGFTGMDRAFMSAGSAKDTGWEKMVNVEIVCPKGTKALYVEPVSEHGDGPGIGWDGKSGQWKLGRELETIIQRNSVLTIIDAKYDENTRDYRVRAYLTYQMPVSKQKNKKKTAKA